ncbi:hypothetical protein JCM10207_006996 [Rhodosporidiobolus poonsookiae]
MALAAPVPWSTTPDEDELDYDEDDLFAPSAAAAFAPASLADSSEAPLPIDAVGSSSANDAPETTANGDAVTGQTENDAESCAMEIDEAHEEGEVVEDETYAAAGQAAERFAAECRPYRQSQACAAALDGPPPLHSNRNVFQDASEVKALVTRIQASATLGNPPPGEESCDWRAARRYPRPGRFDRYKQELAFNRPPSSGMRGWDDDDWSPPLQAAQQPAHLPAEPHLPLSFPSALARPRPAPPSHPVSFAPIIKPPPFEPPDRLAAAAYPSPPPSSTSHFDTPDGVPQSAFDASGLARDRTSASGAFTSRGPPSVAKAPSPPSGPRAMRRLASAPYDASRRPPSTVGAVPKERATVQPARRNSGGATVFPPYEASPAQPRRRQRLPPQEEVAPGTPRAALRAPGAQVEATFHRPPFTPTPQPSSHHFRQPQQQHRPDVFNPSAASDRPASYPPPPPPNRSGPFPSSSSFRPPPFDSGPPPPSFGAPAPAPSFNAMALPIDPALAMTAMRMGLSLIAQVALAQQHMQMQQMQQMQMMAAMAQMAQAQQGPPQVPGEPRTAGSALSAQGHHATPAPPARQPHAARQSRYGAQDAGRLSGGDRPGPAREAPNGLAGGIGRGWTAPGFDG